jgi:hypothetical protein
MTTIRLLLNINILVTRGMMNFFKTALKYYCIFFFMHFHRFVAILINNKPYVSARCKIQQILHCERAAHLRGSANENVK